METAGSRDVVLENDAENFMNGKQKQCRGAEQCRAGTWTSTVGNTPQAAVYEPCD